MAAGQGDASMASCVETSWKVGDLLKVLAQLQGSGAIYFQSHYPNCKFGPDVQLALPLCFIQEHGNKFEEYVILRTQSSAKPWVVEVILFEAPPASPQVRFASGWEEFAADNCLQQGDSLVFVLKVPLPEFEVYMFRGTRRWISSQAPARNWSNIDHCTRVSERTVRSLSYGRSHEHQENDRKTETLQERQQNLMDSSFDQEHNGQNLGDVSSKVPTSGTNALPTFQKRITATSFRHGRIEVPASFVKAHVGHLPRPHHVEVQGIHQDSPVHTILCYWLEQGKIQTRLYFNGGWSRFLEENDLHEGEELRFTLTGPSFFFLVRKV